MHAVDLEGKVTEEKATDFVFWKRFKIYWDASQSDLGPKKVLIVERDLCDITIFWPALLNRIKWLLYVRCG